MTACSVDISERIYRLSAIGQPGASVTCPSVTRQGRPRPTVRYSRSAIADGRRLHVVEGLLAGRRRAGIGDGALQGRQMRPECGMRDRLHVPEMPDQLAAESREFGAAAATATELRRHHRLAERPVQRVDQQPGAPVRSEEHTSELQSLMRTSYAVFC